MLGLGIWMLRAISTACMCLRIIRERELGHIVGFGDMDASGYLDRLYVSKDYQRKGVATAICDRLERGTLTDTVVSHVSVTAKPFFVKRGYVVKQKQQVVRNGVSLTNYVMEKINKA